MTRLRFLLAALGLPVAGQNSQETPGEWAQRTWRRRSPRIPKPKDGECPVFGDNHPMYVSYRWWKKDDGSEEPTSMTVECSHCRCHYSMDVVR